MVLLLHVALDGAAVINWGLPWYGTWKLAHRHGWKLVMVIWKFSWGCWPEHFSFLHPVFHMAWASHSIVWVPRRSMPSTPGQKQLFSQLSLGSCTVFSAPFYWPEENHRASSDSRWKDTVSTSWWEKRQWICSHLYFTTGVFPSGINLVAKDTAYHKMYLWHCQLFHTSTSLCHFLENQLKDQHYPPPFVNLSYCCGE